MNKEIEVTSFKLRQHPIFSIDDLAEAELWLTFKVFNSENYSLKPLFFQYTTKEKTEYYWDTIEDKKADYAEFDIDKINTNSLFTRRKEGVIQNNNWLTYKSKFDTFVYHKFFTNNLVTQATLQEIKLLSKNINSHRYTTASAFLSCLETLNSWST